MSSKKVANKSFHSLRSFLPSCSETLQVIDQIKGYYIGLQIVFVRSRTGELELFHSKEGICHCGESSSWIGL